jgi:hypothetical protein
VLLETVQTVTAWLDDPVTGVNAIRQNIPQYPGDTAPPAVSVVQMFRNGDAARGDAPLVALPALEVSLTGDPAQETAPAVRPFPIDGEVQVSVRYIAAPTTASEVAVRDAALTLRCVARAIATRAIGGTTVNAVQIMTASNVRVLALYVPTGDTICTGALVVTLRVRDSWTHPQ